MQAILLQDECKPYPQTDHMCNLTGIVVERPFLHMKIPDSNLENYRWLDNIFHQRQVQSTKCHNFVHTNVLKHFLHSVQPTTVRKIWNQSKSKKQAPSELQDKICEICGEQVFKLPVIAFDMCSKNTSTCQNMRDTKCIDIHCMDLHQILELSM